MIDKYKKQIIIAFLIVLVLFIGSICISFYFRNNIGSSDSKKLSVNYLDSSSIDITNSFPISDVLGKKIDKSEKNSAYVAINIKNDNDEDVNYQVYLTKNDKKSNLLKSNYIKLYLTDENNNPLEGFEKNLIPTYNKLVSLNDKPGSKLLYEGNIKANTSNKIILRVWVSDSYGLSDILEEFSFKIGVRGK